MADDGAGTEPVQPFGAPVTGPQPDGAAGQVPAVRSCNRGHAMPAGANFCAECGSRERVASVAPVAPAYPMQPIYPMYPQAPPVYSYYQPPAYQLPAYPVRQTNGMAVASMILGILWVYWIGSVLALIFGLVGMAQIKRKDEDGMGMAIAGVILGGIGIGVLVLVIVVASTGPGRG